MEDTIHIQKPEENIKQKISVLLFDKTSPEMITYLRDSEIQLISALETVIENENDIRKGYNIKKNIFATYLKSLKIHRTSRNGWRAEQGERIIKTISEEDTSDTRFKGLRGIFK